MKSESPIYILDNAQFDYPKEKSNIKETLNDNNTVSKIENIQHHIISYKIDDRYDNSIYSEYSYTIGFIFSNGYRPEGVHIRTPIDRIHKNDMGRLFTSNIRLSQLDTKSDLSVFFLITFEYDWYASKKTIPVPSSPVPVALGCRTKFSSQYYQRIYVPIDNGLNLFIEKGHIQLHKK